MAWVEQLIGGESVTSLSGKADVTSLEPTASSQEKSPSYLSAERVIDTFITESTDPERFVRAAITLENRYRDFEELEPLLDYLIDEAARVDPLCVVQSANVILRNQLSEEFRQHLEDKMSEAIGGWTRGVNW